MSKEPKLGMAINTDTGEVTRATPEGVERTIRKEYGGEVLILSDTPANRKMTAQLLRRNGFARRADELEGVEYKDTVFTKFKSVVTTNVNTAEIVVTVVVAGASYLVIRWGLKKVTKMLGWNWFGWNPRIPMVEEKTNVRPIRTAA